MRIRKLNCLYLTTGILLCLAVTAAFGAEEPNDRVVLKGVTFKSGSAMLNKESENSLNKLLAELRTDPHQRIIIEGHTNPTGDERSDIKLSRDRAQAVRQWLVSGGIDKTRIKITALGSSKPLDDKSAAAGQVQNQRIEIIKIKNSFPVAVLPVKNYKFEPVVDGVQVRYDFVVQNKGTATLHINKVRTG
jgi:hypothetical protein